jgi:hypothetical protein
MIQDLRSHPCSHSNPTTNAAGMKPMIYPPEARFQTSPEEPDVIPKIYPPEPACQWNTESVPPAKTENWLPSTAYSANAAAPRQLPRVAPARSTAKVCPVIGTGVNGRWTEKRANPAVSRLNNIIRATSRPMRTPMRSTGRSTSMRERVLA